MNTLSPDASLFPFVLHPNTVMAVLCKGSPSNNSLFWPFQINNSPFSHPTAMILLFGCHATAVA